MDHVSVSTSAVGSGWKFSKDRIHAQKANGLNYMQMSVGVCLQPEEPRSLCALQDNGKTTNDFEQCLNVASISAPDTTSLGINSIQPQ